jgi:hypothetical protein
MVSAATRCVALGYGALALFVAYIVFDIWRARSPAALVWNVTDSWHPLYTGQIPAAENSEDTQLPSPAQVQLEPAAAPAEEEPDELVCVLLIALRFLVGFWLVTTDRFTDIIARFASCMPVSFCEDLVHLAAPLLLSYALLWCDHLDQRSVVETAVLPMMAWSVHRQNIEFVYRQNQNSDINFGIRGPAKDRWLLWYVRSGVLFFAVLRCLGFLWLVPGSAERHALELTAVVMHALSFGCAILFRPWIEWQAGGLQSRELMLAPLFFSPLVHLYVSPPSAWDFAVAIFWTPSWGLFFLLLNQLHQLYSFVEKVSQRLGADAVGVHAEFQSSEFQSLHAQYALLSAEVGPAEARAVAASTLPCIAAGLVVCVWLPLCLVVPQPGCVLYALLALSVVPAVTVAFLTTWTHATDRAPPPCQHVLMSTHKDALPAIHGALFASLPFLLHLSYAHPVTRVPLAFLLPTACWFGDSFATSFQSGDVRRDLLSEFEGELASVCEALEQEQEKCVGLQEKSVGLQKRLSNATERCRRLQKAERRLQVDQADASRPGGQAHGVLAANMAAAVAAAVAAQTSVAEAAMAEAAAARREAVEANAFASAATEAAAREKRRFTELKREAEVERCVVKAAGEQAVVLRKRADEMEKQRDAARAEALQLAPRVLRLSTEDAARRREVLALQASVDELGLRVEHHRTAAGTLRTRNTELKAQLKEQRRLADRAVAAAALMQEAGSQGAAAAAAADADAALAAELAAMPPPASQHTSSSHGWLECSICLQDLRGASAEERLALPCAHVFHAACVEPWLRTHSNCPECQTPAR